MAAICLILLGAFIFGALLYVAIAPRSKDMETTAQTRRTIKAECDTCFDKDEQLIKANQRIEKLEKAMSYMDLPVDTRLRILVREALKES